MTRIRAAVVTLFVVAALGVGACGGDNKGTAGPSGNQIQPTPVLASPASP
jgi:hypothetical protein